MTHSSELSSWTGPAPLPSSTPDWTSEQREAARISREARTLVVLSEIRARLAEMGLYELEGVLRYMEEQENKNG